MRAFVSYRRGDSAGLGRLLVDRLRQLPELDDVFFDVQSIGVGTQFPEEIRKAITDSDIFLALIGPAWAGEKPDGTNRLHEDGDFVRMEIAHALATGCRIVPVFIQDGMMPAPEALPEDVRPMALTNGVRLSHENFDTDFANLAHRAFGLDAARVLRGPGLDTGERAKLGTKYGLWGLAGAGLGLIALLGVALLHGLLLGRPLQDTLGTRSLVWAVILGFPLAGAGLAMSWRRRRANRQRRASRSL